MYPYTLPINPPTSDNHELIEGIMAKAFEDFLKKGYNKSRFKDLYDLIFEEIENNIEKFEPEVRDDFGN